MLQIIQTEIALGHVTSLGVVLRRAIRTSPGAITTSHTFLRIQKNNAVVTKLICVCRTNSSTFGIDTMVAGDGQVISEDCVVPGAFFFLPGPARYFNHTPPQHIGWEIVLILAGCLAGFAAGAEPSSNEKAYWVVMLPPPSPLAP